jgi:hypothetical protein
MSDGKLVSMVTMQAPEKLLKILALAIRKSQTYLEDAILS